MKKAIVMLFVLVLFAGCSSPQTTVNFDPSRLTKTTVSGASTPVEAVDLFLDYISQSKWINASTWVGQRSAALTQSGGEYVVVSVVCTESNPSDDIGRYNSDPLFSILRQQGDTWRFVRLPDEAITSVGTEGASSFKKLPAILNEEALSAGWELSKELEQELPEDCSS